MDVTAGSAMENDMVVAAHVADPSYQDTFVEDDANLASELTAHTQVLPAISALLACICHILAVHAHELHGDMQWNQNDSCLIAAFSEMLERCLTRVSLQDHWCMQTL